MLHHPQSVVDDPALRYLAVGDAVNDHALYIYPVVRGRAKGLRLTGVGTLGPLASYNLVPFGHLVLYGVLKVWDGLAFGGGEVLDGLRPM